MNKMREVWVFLFIVCFVFEWNSIQGAESVKINYKRGNNESSSGNVGRLVKKDEWKRVFSNEFGWISSVDIDDGTGRHINYHLEFVSMEPNSLFLPVLLHSDMVFYVHTGSGRLSWIDNNKDKVKRVELQGGDVYRLRSGALFYLHSSLDSERSRLRIISIFASNDDENELQFEDSSIGPYSSVNDLIRGFDTKVLQAAFQVPEEVVEEIRNATDMPAIVHAETEMKKNNLWDENAPFLDVFLSIKRYNKVAAYEHKKKERKPFNFFEEDADVKNCHGWSTVVTKHDLHALEGSHVGAFMVNLTKGSMMAPHWNAKATEVSVVLQGEGMVRIVCPSTSTSKECKHSRFRVEEGDVFVVPRFHPMSQTTFNDKSLTFMGFSSTVKKNHPQFLVGKASVLRTLDKFVLAASFGVSNATIDKLLAARKQSTIMDCTSCAEEEEMLMEKEIDEARQKEEEKRKKEEEEERKREEEERKGQEEEEKTREEEEKKRREEEEKERERQEEEEKRHREEKEREGKQEEKEEEIARREERERRERERELDEAARRRGIGLKMEQFHDKMVSKGKMVRGKYEARRYAKGGNRN